MKKALIMTFGLFVAVLGIMSCGDSAAEEARLKAIRDSISNDSLMQIQAAAEQARMDSLAAVAAADSARAQFVADSLADAEAAKTGKPRPKVVKPAPTPTPQPTPTPTPDPKTGKDAIKGGTGTPTSGKDAIKGTTETPKSGKDAIKGK
ncbi:MAG: hypothetical protein IPN95_03160 [Bacteroidetes bacterium]|nr:hypothetical protein [Bacteroidota bacterium]MBL0017961.1 hypothetical protein [Bacteroidota bacterium]MBP6640804.1 hypothetical protein [Bacteroidia bacterium]MBP6721461.1 hypothetical protein [Bacteroidia bacterium]MBP8074083.1 hypothetical protein [Bacteroidia bacterium]